MMGKINVNKFVNGDQRELDKAMDRAMDKALDSIVKLFEEPTKPCEKSTDTVNHPSHYCDGKIETIDFIEDKKLNYYRGNAVKYISRAGKKDKSKEVEDLKKAVWYLTREIEMLTRTNKS